METEKELFLAERDHLVCEVVQGLEDVVRHMKILNTKMESMTSLRNDLTHVTDLWSKFQGVVQKTTEGLQKELVSTSIQDTTLSSSST